MPLVGFEPTISADGRLRTYAMDCAATGTGNHKFDYKFDVILTLHRR